MVDESSVSALEEIIGYHFEDPKILESLLSHKEEDNSQEKDVLSFYGLGLYEDYINRYFIEHFLTLVDGTCSSQYTEKQLSSLKRRLISTSYLSGRMQYLNLCAFLSSSLEEEKEEKMLSSFFCSLFAVIYLDSHQYFEDEEVQLEKTRDCRVAFEHLSGIQAFFEDGGDKEDYQKRLLSVLEEEHLTCKIDVMENELSLSTMPEMKYTCTIKTSAEDLPIGSGYGSSKLEASQQASKELLGIMEKKGYFTLGHRIGKAVGKITLLTALDAMDILQQRKILTGVKITDLPSSEDGFYMVCVSSDQTKNHDFIAEMNNRNAAIRLAGYSLLMSLVKGEEL